MFVVGEVGGEAGVCFVGCLTSQQQASVSQGRICLTSQQQASVSQGLICSDKFTCCHTEIEVTDQTFHLTQSQYADTGRNRPSTDPITPGAWQGSHWSANVEVAGVTRPRKNPGASGIRTRDSALEADALPVKQERLVVKQERLMVKQERLVVKQERLVVKQERLVVKQERLVVKQERLMVKQERLVVKQERLMVKQERLVVKQERLVVRG